jgi:mannosyltransferase
MPSEPLSSPAALTSWNDLPAGRYALPVLALILVAAALIRMPGLFASLWYDEVMYTRVFFDDPGHRSWLLWKDVHPPVYALLLWGWSSLLGNHEAVLRLPSYLCGLASLVVTWALARRCFGAGVALLACALLAFSPPHIWHSVESKTNMLALFLSVLAVWSNVRAAEPYGDGTGDG